ncbi:MAG: hypothetical protein J7K40_02135 [candidate division Zixibacteria bacterium]|nr:hypothetical protein [candidate division Zixibacteria bacterium]
MFCSYCNEFINGNSFVYDDEEYCSKECLMAARDEIEGDLEKYMEEREEIEEYN